jgi:VWFA-related protein
MLSQMAVLGVITVCCAVSSAQPAAPAAQTAVSPSEPQSAEAPGFTLHTGVRVVLTDVTVTDSHGNVIHHLPRSAFQITDDGKPQRLSSFKESDGTDQTPVVVPVTAPGVYSNEFLQHLPPVLNILVLDTVNLGIIEQMSFNVELTHFLKTLPPNQSLAMYARTGEQAVLIQNFTTDHNLLLSAAAKVLPRLAPPGRDPLRISDTNLLQQIAAQLEQIPGRKNVLWFSGGSASFLVPDPTATGEDPGALRQIYDELEAARIAIYPFDARGLQVSIHAGVTGQHMQMEDIADATGGQPVINTNGLTSAADHVLATDTSFYTLTYSPPDFKADNKWHKVHVTVEGNYRLSYRRGYYADGNNLDTPHPNKSRTRLLASGQTRDVPADIHSSPIIFEAGVRPVTSTNQSTSPNFYRLHPVQPAKKGAQSYLVEYTLPPDTFATQTVDGRQSANFDIAALAFNQAGERLALDAQRVHVKFPANDPHRAIQVAQQLDLRKGDVYLFLAVWDTATGRLGTLQIPLKLPLPPASTADLQQPRAPLAEQRP